MLYLFDYVRVDVEWIRESEEQRRMQIRFNHLARVYCVHAIQSYRFRCLFRD